ncbi:hypothetical protein [Pelomonas sp. Root1237]|uniref:hypothetical protein n=1 Tax=Pelomonas sp. Root1237 TaxID=1736434 RepID=UPI0006F89047|nr:hypothetical protein [Pelomonas sp. Root1237]KQV87430.1 hypothetical protein ASC91_17565 [Pelomonas sp. Root1237]
MDATIATIIGATIGLAGTTLGSLIANFLGEDYKRFRDAQALAGGLAGELASHAEGAAMMRPLLDTLIAQVAAGTPIAPTPQEKPVSRFYDANVSKIGLLGASAAEQVVRTYDLINAFRLAMGRLYDADKTEQSMQLGHLHVARWALGKAAEGAGLIDRLHAFAGRGYRPFRRWDA